MRWPIVLAAIAIVAPIHSASAQIFPRHKDVCVGGIVSKEKLAKAFVRVKPEWYDLYVRTLESAGNRQQVWLTIFTDDNFCENNPACLGPDPDAKPSKDPNAKPKLNTVGAKKTLDDLRVAFRFVLEDETGPGKSYAISSIPARASYFLGDDKQNAIRCLANEPLIASKSPSLNLPSQLRLRANSDDLKIPSDADAFKGVTPATVSFTRDGTTTKTNTTKLQAALGYAFDLKTIFPANSNDYSYFDGELVPYISATQSISKVAGKAATFADSNNVAVGAQLNTQMTLDQTPGVNHVLSAKPQYLWNTKDNSEIASVRAVYEPWSYGTPIPINAPFRRTLITDTWLQVLFDLRTDVGEYTKVGIDPKTASTHTSFTRSGSHFGFAVGTVADGPHVVLNVTETMLYGFMGSVRQLSYFDSNLSYYFDSTDRFAFTVKYTKGQNEDTAEWAQTATVGFSAKF
jgi:hypothetical protein